MENYLFQPKLKMVISLENKGFEVLCIVSAFMTGIMRGRSIARAFNTRQI